MYGTNGKLVSESKSGNFEVKKVAKRGVFSNPENIRKLIELRNSGMLWKELSKEFGVADNTCRLAFQRYSGCSTNVRMVFEPTVEEVAKIYSQYRKGIFISKIAYCFDLRPSRMRKFIDRLVIELEDYDVVAPLSKKATKNILESKVRYEKYGNLDAKIKERYFILGNIKSKSQIIRALVEECK